MTIIAPGESSQPSDQTQVSCIAGRFFTVWATREALWTLYLVQDLNQNVSYMWPKPIKLLEESIGANLYHLGLCKDFLGKKPKA